MTVYFYQATDRTGKVIEGNIDAPDYRLAIQKVRGLNYFPIQVSEQKIKNGFSLNLDFSGFRLFPKISHKQLLAFTQQLATLVSSGLTLDKSLSVLVKLADGEAIRSTLTDIQKRVHSGSTFADALNRYPNIFSKLYLNMIRAGETGGILGPVLLRLSDFLESSEELKNNIRSALVYPILLTLVGGAAIVVLMTVVIPKFAVIFSDLDQGLPLPTMLLLATSDFIGKYWWALILLLVGGIVSLSRYLKTEAGKHRWDSLLLKLPLFGALVQKIEVSRFSRTMAALLNSGVPILQSLSVVQSILGNSVIAASMDSLHKGLKGGKGISTPLQKADLFPPMAVHMITVGEETGTLEEMLTKIADNYDKEVARAIKSLISLIEPLMILIMGAAVGFIVISMLMAVFSINDVPL
ncbi:MAG: type II secretion system F family protein [Nitrospinales bacterium]